MYEHDLKPNKGAKHRKKRIGRGDGSGRGNYSGRGMKGQSARSGGRRRPGFEGGQTPLYQKMPKLRGFKNPKKVNYQIINFSSLEVFSDGDTVDVNSLTEKGIIRSKVIPVKLLGNGEISKKITIKVDAASKSAVEKAEKNGIKIELSAPRKQAPKEKKESKEQPKEEK